MHIIHLILTSRFAGSERYAIELANAQSMQHQVTVVLTRKGAQERSDGLKHRLSERVNVHVLSSRTSLFQIFEARRFLSNTSHDVAHAHLSTACKAINGASLKSRRVATLHIRYKQRQHANLDGLIAIAPWQLGNIPEKLAIHSQHIDNWTSARLAEPGAREAIRAQYGIGQNEILIGALGRVVDSKGFDTLITAFEQCRFPNLRLAIVGDGKAWKLLRKSAGPRVIMPGFQPRPENWLAAFDVFVSPARSEPFGLVFLEAMNSGLPIIATASQGASHLHHLIQTPLVPIDDVDSMHRALESFCSYPVTRMQYDLSRYRIESKAREIESFYSSLIV